jgi:hypothetical protein
MVIGVDYILKSLQKCLKKEESKYKHLMCSHNFHNETFKEIDKTLSRIRSIEESIAGLSKVKERVMDSLIIDINNVEE